MEMNGYQNTRSKPSSYYMPARVVDGNYAAVVEALTGIGPQALNELGSAMAATLLSEVEVIAGLYVRVLQSISKGISRTTHRFGEDANPMTIFALAGELRNQVNEDVIKGCDIYTNIYRSQIPPTISNPEFKHVQLRKGGVYKLTAHAGNSMDVVVQIGGIEHQLSPGGSMLLEKVDSVDVASQIPQIVSWERVGGSVRAGTLSGVIPWPKKTLPVVEQPAVEEPVEQPITPEPIKRGWNIFKRSAS